MNIFFTLFILRANARYATANKVSMPSRMVNELTALL